MSTDTLEVFHVTTLARAERCLDEGIVPGKTTECLPSTVELDVEFDKARPEHIIALGVSRLDSVYAHPQLEKALNRKNGGWLRRSPDPLVVLRVEVNDPDLAYVCDGLMNAEPYDKYPEVYWSSLTSLKQYHEQEKPTYIGPHLPYDKGLQRFVYMWPEVLLPGVVEPSRISLEQIV